MDPVVNYLLAAMLAWVPPSAQSPYESRAEALARYENIARDAAEVAFDESEAPLFDGPDARLETALLVLSVASYESAFRKRVDVGEGRGDSGRSYCLMQILVSDARRQLTGDDLVRDRKLCLRAGLHLLRGSFGICRKLPLVDRLSAYATGRCIAGTLVSRDRVQRALHWFGAHALPHTRP